MSTETERERKSISEEAILTILLNLMQTQGWDVEKAMDALMIPASERSLYARSVAYALARRAEVSATAIR